MPEQTTEAERLRAWLEAIASPGSVWHTNENGEFIVHWQAMCDAQAFMARQALEGKTVSEIYGD